jgi:hypothetical protein
LAAANVGRFPNHGQDDNGFTIWWPHAGQLTGQLKAASEAGRGRLGADPAGDLAVNAGPVQLRHNSGLQIDPGGLLIGYDGDFVPGRNFSDESATKIYFYTRSFIKK